LRTRKKKMALKEKTKGQENAGDVLLKQEKTQEWLGEGLQYGVVRNKKKNSKGPLAAPGGGGGSHGTKKKLQGEEKVNLRQKNWPWEKTF